MDISPMLEIVVSTDFSLASGRNLFTGILRDSRLKRDWNIRILQSSAVFVAHDQPARTVVCRTENEVIVRESAAPTKPAAHLIRRALEFVSGNASRHISVSDVVRYLGVSKRLTELRFREIQGQTIQETIIRTRLAENCRLLKETDTPIGQISRDCGFSNIFYLKTLFKARFGFTMRDYRIRIRSE